MKIVIADDEDLARKRVLNLLKEAGYTDGIYEASNGKEAIQLINDIRPDLVFLDIQMTDITGFDILAKIDLSFSPLIIFVTAYDNFAVKAFEVQALDFLLKPYSKNRFFDSLDRSVKKINENKESEFTYKLNDLLDYIQNENSLVEYNKTSYLNKIALKVGKRYYFVDIKTIKYIISSGYYAEIYTLDNSKHLYRISMTDFMTKLDPAYFIRVNRSAIIKIREIKEVVSEGQGDYSIIMRDDKKFSLTTNYKSNFLQTLRIK